MLILSELTDPSMRTFSFSFLLMTTGVSSSSLLVLQYNAYITYTEYTSSNIASTSMNALCIRNWQMLLHMCQTEDVCALTRWQHFYAWNNDTAASLKLWCFGRNPTPAISAYLLEEQCHQISFWSDLKQRLPRLIHEMSHGSRLESMTSYRKSDCFTWCIFTWRTILPNFFLVRFKMTKTWPF